MGNSNSLERVSNEPSIPSEVDIDEAKSTPLRNCSNRDLYCLCDHYNFNNPTVKKSLSNKDFDGKLFKKLATLTDDEDISREKEELCITISKFIDGNNAVLFIDQVVMSKIKDDELLFQKDVAVTNCTSSNTYKILNGSRSASSTDAGPVIVNAMVGPTQIKYDNSLLTSEEKKRMKFVRGKVEAYYKFLEKNERPRTKVGMTEDLELDSQNLVCSDRFLNKAFLSTILRRNDKKTHDEAYLKVKLLISDLNASPFEFKLANFFMKSDFGVVHTALLIGEWKIEWVSSSLVIVRSDSQQKVQSDSVISAVDIGTICGAQSVMKTFKTLSEIICKYNGSVTYNRFTANCQDFTAEVLSALGLSFPKSESFEQYFSQLKKGDMSRTFVFCEALRKLIKKSTIPNEYVDKTQITFNDRKSLDIFADFLDKILYFEKPEGIMDFWLLKAFDRSFVVARNPEDDKQMETSFFSDTNSTKENSILHIRYSVKDVDFSEFKLRNDNN